MSITVWTLSADLDAKTATFKSNMADAAKAARSSFTDIKSGASEMSSHFGTNMFAARHTLMALSEELGGTMPRALTAFIAELGPVGPALTAAFPFAALSLGAFLLLERMAKMRQEARQLAEDTTKFGTAGQNAFNSLDQKLLQSQIHADELRNDHLGALKLQLELIDKQSMAELVHEFDTVAKAAGVVFGELQSHWYTWGIGSAGAKHALELFQTQYESLIAQGKAGQATDLLQGTLKSAQTILEAQKQAKASGNGFTSTKDDSDRMTNSFLEANAKLKAAGVGYTEKEVAAQEKLVKALQDQATIEAKVATLKKQDSANASTETGKQLAALQAEAARTAAEHSQKMGEIQLAAERESANASLAIHNASIQQRLASDIALADKELTIELQGNQALIAALDKGGKDYTNQLKALHDKAEELTAQHAAKISDLTAKASIEQHAKELADMEESERGKINATAQGSMARLAVIMAAMKAEDALGLQATQHYRELAEQRVQAEREAGEEASKLAAEAGKESAAQEQAMGQLRLAALKEQQQLEDSLLRLTAQQRMEQAIADANAEYALQLTAMQKEIDALNKTEQDYQNKLKALQDKEKQLVQQHENDITAIKEKAETERNQKILSAEQNFSNSITSGLTQVIMGHKSFASMMNSLGDQVVSGMIQRALQSLAINAMTRLTDAAMGARKAYLAGVSAGGPAAPVTGATYAAEAFAAMMAFNEGGIVPGIGDFDSVSARLTPGEIVIPKALSEKLIRSADSNDSNGGTHYHTVNHIHMHASALDSSGMDTVLAKHSDKLQKHFENTLRKLNK